MKVNSSTKVTNLNAHKLDGQDSTTIGIEMGAVVDAGGTLVRGRGNPTVTRIGQGVYTVKFGSDISKCAYTATIIAEPIPGSSAIVLPQDSSTVQVLTSLETVTIWDLPFNLIVAC
jgi:hypothetical protein